MKRLHALLLGCAFVPAVALSTPASAADLPLKAPPPAYLPTYFTWTGLYAGINGGYGWSSSFADNAKGAVYGGQLGYNMQFGGLVAGVEGDFQGTTIKATETAGTTTVEGKIPAFATVRGRLGYAFDRMMIYGTGGWAYTRTKLSLSAPGGSVDGSAWSSGYAIGGGVEWAVWDRWSLKGEYLYVASGDVTLNVAGATATGSFKYNVVRAGLNYRF
ncbi:MAG: porin family protein [Proteobacteria bacterium]|nr:porin family protein [Pseudomonadota bacterium]